MGLGRFVTGSNAFAEDVSGLEFWDTDYGSLEVITEGLLVLEFRERSWMPFGFRSFLLGACGLEVGFPK